MTVHIDQPGLITRGQAHNRMAGLFPAIQQDPPFAFLPDEINLYIFLSLQAEMLYPIFPTALYFPVQLLHVLSQILQPARQSILYAMHRKTRK